MVVLPAPAKRVSPMNVIPSSWLFRVGPTTCRDRGKNVIHTIFTRGIVELRSIEPPPTRPTEVPFIVRNNRRLRSE